MSGLRATDETAAREARDGIDFPPRPVNNRRNTGSGRPVRRPLLLRERLGLPKFAPLLSGANKKPGAVSRPGIVRLHAHLWIMPES